MELISNRLLCLGELSLRSGHARKALLKGHALFKWYGCSIYPGYAPTKWPLPGLGMQVMP